MLRIQNSSLKYKHFQFPAPPRAFKTRYPSSNNTPAHLVYLRKFRLPYPFPCLAGNSRREVLAGNTLAAVDKAARIDLEAAHRVLVDSLADMDRGYHSHIGLEVVSRDSPDLVGLLDLHRSAPAEGSLEEGHLVLSVAGVSTGKSSLLKENGRTYDML